MRKVNKLYHAKYGKNQSEMKGYSALVNRIRIRLLSKAINPSSEDQILEIGCNDGLLLSEIARHGASVVGIEVNEEIIKLSHHDNIQLMDATALHFGDATFDKVYSCHVLEHIPDLEKALAEVCRVLRPGGRFISLFPYEPFRGARALKDSLREGKGLSHARQLHLHKLSVRKIKSLTSSIPFRLEQSKIVFTPFPDGLVILVKDSHNFAASR